MTDEQLADLIERYAVSIGHDSYSLTDDERHMIVALVRANADAILRDLVEVWDKDRGFPPQDVADLMSELRDIVERAREYGKQVEGYRKAAKVRGS